MKYFAIILIPLVHFSGVNILVKGAEGIFYFILALLVGAQNNSALDLRRLKGFVSVNALFAAAALLSLVGYKLTFGSIEISEWYLIKLLKWTAYFVMGAVLVFEIKDSNKLLVFIKAYVLISFFSTVVMGYIQYFGNVNFLMPEYYSRALYTGISERFFSFINPDPNIAFLELVLLVALSWALLALRQGWIYWLIFCLSVGALFLTYSRTGYIAVVFSLSFLFWCRRGFPYKWSIIAFFTLFFLMCLFLAWGKEDLFEGNRMGSLYNFLVRYRVWEALVEYNGLSYIFGAGGVDPRVVAEASTGNFITPHNSYLEAVFDFGGVFLLTYVLVLIGMLVTMYKLSIAGGHSELSVVATLITYLLLVYMISMLMVSVTLSYEFFIILVLTCSVWRISTESKQQDDLV